MEEEPLSEAEIGNFRHALIHLPPKLGRQSPPEFVAGGDVRDRDEHIVVVWDNIDPAKRNDFKQQVDDGRDLGEYGYDSIMHYGPSEGDVRALARLYES